MSFLWARSLLLLGLIPLFVVFYLWLLRRRRQFTVHYSSLSLVRDAVGRQSRWKRHVPFALFLLALTSLVLALSRPVTMVTLPSNKATIIVAIDVSPSMCSNDIKPNRLEVAKAAAESFVRTEAPTHQIGIVAFAGFAELVQPPTDNVHLLNTAIDNLFVARRTAIGSAILRSIDAVSEVDSRVAPSDVTSGSGSPKPAAEPVPHIIVLLTDGASNAGPPPLEAAQQALERGLRVYTIGFGTDSTDSIMDCGSQFQESTFFGGGLGQASGMGGSHREIDEATLKQIASLTGGTYSSASSASDLENVFRNLPTVVVATRETVEISVFFTAFAALVMILAVLLSWRWNPLS